MFSLIRIAIPTLIAILAWMAFAVLVSTTTRAGEIEVMKYNNSNNHYISYTGVVEEGDLDKLEKAYGDYKLTRSTRELILESPGGSGFEMKKIAEWIKDKDIVTRVAKDGDCLSACAVIWAAAPDKKWHKGTKVGFHVGSSSGTPVKDFIDAHGYLGFQTYVQEQFSSDIQYYAKMPVKDPVELAKQVLIHGNTSAKFFVLNEKDARNIIGAEIK